MSAALLHSEMSTDRKTIRYESSLGISWLAPYGDPINVGSWVVFNGPGNSRYLDWVAEVNSVGRVRIAGHIDFKGKYECIPITAPVAPTSTASQ